jgi:hypothetical protein
MPVIPPPVLKKLYVVNSLQAKDDRFNLRLRNTLAPAVLIDFQGIGLSGGRIQPEQVMIEVRGQRHPAASIKEETPVLFPLGETLSLQAEGVTLAPGRQELEIDVVIQDVGAVSIPVADNVG